MWSQRPKRRPERLTAQWPVDSSQLTERTIKMDLTKEEYERLIELQAVALGCAERSLATLREEHERLKKDLEEKREFTKECLAKEVAHAKAQNELKKALEEERKLTRDLRRQIVAYVHNSSNGAQEVLS